jgi:hypothetical protein
MPIAPDAMQKMNSAKINGLGVEPVADIVKYFEDQEVHIMTDEQGKVWFQAKHVCDVLGYNTSQTARAVETHVEPEDRHKTSSGNFNWLRADRYWKCT